MKKTKSPSGRTAGLALKAVKSPGAPGILDLLRLCCTNVLNVGNIKCDN